MSVYCFCKRGKLGDSRGFMIECDSCQTWFHGRCIGLRGEDAPPEHIPWYCDNCLKSVPQCANPECVNGVTREKSKYCSDACGYKINKIRYDKFFRPRWEQLAKNHSAGRFTRMKELSKLEKDKEDVINLIGRLKHEKEELEANIAKIKSDAKKLREDNATVKDEIEDENDDENEEQEETTSSDQSKVFCIICGMPQPSEKAFKHWASCHRKQESNFNFTSDVQIKLRCPGVDEEPNLYCQRQDKKTKRYCMHIESACPQHSNWQFDEDEVCGCPLNISQGLVLDGNYCLELKRDCKLHYNWDRFRLASKNMERIQAFSRLDSLSDRINRTQISLNDTYGGVIGIMRHITIDHVDEGKDENFSNDNNEQIVDVDMVDD